MKTRSLGAWIATVMLFGTALSCGSESGDAVETTSAELVAWADGQMSQTLRLNPSDYTTGTVRNICELTVAMPTLKPLVVIAPPAPGAPAPQQVIWTGSAVSVGGLTVNQWVATEGTVTARWQGTGPNGSLQNCDLMMDDGSSRLVGRAGSSMAATTTAIPTTPLLFNQDVRLAPGGSIAGSCVLRQSELLRFSSATNFQVFVNGAGAVSVPGPTALDVAWPTEISVPFGLVSVGTEPTATRIKHVTPKKAQLDEGDTLRCAGVFRLNGASVFEVNTGTSAGPGMSLMRTATGWTCSASAFGSGDGCDCDCGIMDPDCGGPCPASCGNSVLDPAQGEQCDHDEIPAGTNGCATYPVYNGGTLKCTPTCTLDTSGCVFCNDGTVQPNEDCEDGNLLSGDGCSAECQTEPTEVEPNEDGTPQTGGGFITGNDFSIANANGPFDAAAGDVNIRALINPAGDEDVFAVRNTTGSPVTVRFDVWNPDTGTGFGFGMPCGTSSDTVVNVRNNLGTIVVSNDNRLPTDLCSGGVFGLNPGQILYVHVMGWGDLGTLGPYVLQLAFKAGGCGDGVQVSGEQCDDDNLIDGDGCSSTCTCEGCTAGMFQCVGTTLLGCTTPGSCLQPIQTCAREDLCDEANGVCDACAPNEHRCSGATYQVCNATQTGWTDVETCATAALCSMAGCTPPTCDAGEFQCDLATRQVCNANQNGWDDVETCASAALCTAAACVQPACDPSEYRCNVQILEQCNADLTGWNYVEGCSGPANCSTSPPSCTAPVCDWNLGSNMGNGIASGQLSSGMGDHNTISCAGGGGADFMYSWTSPTRGTYVFDTNGSNYDTALTLSLPGCSGSDHACDDDCGTGNDSRVVWGMAPAQTAGITIDGYQGALGSWVLNINYAPCGQPGVACNNSTISSCVCASMPSCCNTAWDQNCAYAVFNLGCYSTQNSCVP